MCISNLSRVCYIPSRLIYLDFITLIILDEENKLLNFLHSLVICTLLSPNIPLNTLSSNTYNLCSFITLRCRVLLPVSQSLLFRSVRYHWKFGCRYLLIDPAKFKILVILEGCVLRSHFPVFLVDFCNLSISTDKLHILLSAFKWTHFTQWHEFICVRISVVCSLIYEFSC